MAEPEIRTVDEPQGEAASGTGEDATQENAVGVVEEVGEGDINDISQLQKPHVSSFDSLALR